MRPIWTVPPLMLIAATAATAQTPLTPEEALTRVFSSPLQAEWFAPDLLAEMPLDFLQAQIQAVTQSYGPLQRVEVVNKLPSLVFERGTLPLGVFGLDAQGRITALALSSAAVQAAPPTSASAPTPEPAPTAEPQPTELPVQVEPPVPTTLAEPQPEPVPAEQPAQPAETPPPAETAQPTEATQSTEAAAVSRAPSGTEMLSRLLATAPIDTALFNAEFLQAVPAATLTQMFSELRGQLGEYRGAEETAQGWTLDFERGQLPVLALTVDASGLVSGFRIGVPVPRLGSLAEAEAAFAALGGQVSLLVTEVGQAPSISLNTRRPLAVGSTFKLAILSELQAQVSAGSLTWEQEVTLTDAARSLPSGTLQDAANGSRYSLRDLADRMIRDSDNTATDLLLDVVGREGVARRLGQRVVPSTREAFALKNPANAKLLRAYRAALTDTAQRQAVLSQAANAPLPAAEVFMRGQPIARDVEWFVSTEHLCSLMNEVAAQPSTQLNPGLANKSDFAGVSYKGGSEPGVLNLTTQVTTKAGKSYCVSATWNDAKALDDARFMGLYTGLLGLLR